MIVPWSLEVVLTGHASRQAVLRAIPGVVGSHTCDRDASKHLVSGSRSFTWYGGMRQAMCVNETYACGLMNILITERVHACEPATTTTSRDSSRLVNPSFKRCLDDAHAMAPCVLEHRPGTQSNSFVVSTRRTFILLARVTLYSH